MVKKIGEVGQEKGWYGGERSPRVLDLRPSERLKELVRHRKGMERITKKGSDVLKVSPQTYSRLFSREPLAGVRDTIGSERTELSSWVPDMGENGGWAGSYSYRPSSFEQLRRGYETQPGRLVPVAEIEGLNPEFGLRPQVMTQLSPIGPVPSEVGDTEGPMPAWTTGSDLARRNRSRMPEFRERWRMAQMQHIAADPFGNMRVNQLMSGIPAKASAPSSAVSGPPRTQNIPGVDVYRMGGGADPWSDAIARFFQKQDLNNAYEGYVPSPPQPRTNISKEITAGLGKRKGAPKPYLPGRTRMPFEIP